MIFLDETSFQVQWTSDLFSLTTLLSSKKSSTVKLSILYKIVVCRMLINNMNQHMFQKISILRSTDIHILRIICSLIFFLLFGQFHQINFITTLEEEKQQPKQQKIMEQKDLFSFPECYSNPYLFILQSVHKTLPKSSLQISKVF